MTCRSKCAAAVRAHVQESAGDGLEVAQSTERCCPPAGWWWLLGSLAAAGDLWGSAPGSLHRLHRAKGQKGGSPLSSRREGWQPWACGAANQAGRQQRMHVHQCARSHCVHLACTMSEGDTPWPLWAAAWTSMP